MPDPHVTIPDEDPIIQYTVTTADDEFTFPFTYFDETDIKVYDGEDLISSSDYTITGNTGTTGGYDGGTVTLDTAVTDTTITILRDVPVARTTDFPISGPFNITTLNTQLDKLFAIIQQLELLIARALTVPNTDDPTLDMQIPSATDRANKFLSFDANGEPQTADEVTSGVYYGPDDADPATRPDGSASVAGDLYYNTTTQQLKVYSGTAWAAATHTNPITSTFTGDGVETQFTLDADPGSENSTIVTWDGAVQHRSTYSVSGTALTFSSAPGNGVAIEVTILGVAMSFGVPADLSVTTDKLVDDAVTYAKMQNVSATSRVLGRKTAAAGDTEECTLSEVLDFVGSAAQGDILYRGAATWTRLGAGTDGQVLETNGAGQNPEWANKARAIMAFSSLTSGVGAGLTRYLGIANHNATENIVDIVVPATGTLRNMYALADGTPSAGQTYVYTLRKNASDSSVTSTTTNAGRTSSDTTNTLSVTAGDVISVKIVTSASATVATHRVTLEFEKS